MTCALQSENLPLPLMTSEVGSFARLTITERKPQIIEQVVADNAYPPEIVAALHAFREEIAGKPVRPLAEPVADAAFWNQEMAAYRGRTWLELPWYLAETFFYRRVLEAVQYLAPGPWQGRDPFALAKRRVEQEAVAWLAGNWEQLDRAEPAAAFDLLLHSCLWGNRADLSHPTVREGARSGLDTREERRHLLIDHSDRAAAFLLSGVQRVDFVNDNTGRELLFDLALADFLLSQGRAGKVVFHLKNRPFFVSDAMPQEVRAILSLLDAATGRGGQKAKLPLPPAQALGRRLAEHLATGCLVLRQAPFWTSCLMFRQMPLELSDQLAQADLVILKGDVNYRRLLDDRHWPHTARVEKIAAYFPAPFLLLRTLKGEIMTGLQPGQAEALSAQDPDWLTDGKRGMIQLVTIRP